MTLRKWRHASHVTRHTSYRGHSPVLTLYNSSNRLVIASF